MTAGTPSDSPIVARRRVRLALREAREALGRTQSEVAEEMEWSLSKVIRIENGEVSISPNDLRPLLAYLQIKDRATVDAMMRDAKLSRTRQKRFWWREAPFKDDLTPSMQRLIEFELDAVAARYFAIYIIPGPLQTPSFARAVMQQWDEDLSDEVMNVRVEARMRRRQALLSREHPVKMSVLLDESLVRRPFGGEKVLMEQLADLETVAAQGLVDLRIVPFAIPGPLPTYGSFDLVYLSEDGDDENAVIYREYDFQDEIVEDRVSAARFHERFDELWNASLDETATIDMIRQRLSELSKNNSSS